MIVYNAAVECQIVTAGEDVDGIDLNGFTAAKGGFRSVFASSAATRKKPLPP